MKNRFVLRVVIASNILMLENHVTNVKVLIKLNKRYFFVKQESVYSQVYYAFSAVVIARIKAAGSGLSAVACILKPNLINASLVTGPIATAFTSFVL